MKLSNYIELAIMLFLIIVVGSLLVYCLKKVSDVKCDCKIHKGSDIDRECINRIDERNCGEDKNERPSR